MVEVSFPLSIQVTILVKEGSLDQFLRSVETSTVREPLIPEFSLKVRVR
jgi:hypothetical protein